MKPSRTGVFRSATSATGGRPRPVRGWRRRRGWGGVGKSERTCGYSPSTSSEVVRRPPASKPISSVVPPCQGEHDVAGGAERLGDVGQRAARTRATALASLEDGRQVRVRIASRYSRWPAASASRRRSPPDAVRIGSVSSRLAGDHDLAAASVNTSPATVPLCSGIVGQRRVLLGGIVSRVNARAAGGPTPAEPSWRLRRACPAVPGRCRQAAAVYHAWYRHPSPRRAAGPGGDLVVEAGQPQHALRVRLEQQPARTGTGGRAGRARAAQSRRRQSVPLDPELHAAAPLSSPCAARPYAIGGSRRTWWRPTSSTHRSCEADERRGG